MEQVEAIVTVLSVIFSLIGIIYSIIEIARYWHLRNIREVLGIKSGDDVLIVCSELPDPIDRQMVEPREYIYLMKYGDLDAWVEYLLSMVKMFPKVNLHIKSSGEALQNPMDLEGHISIIGGPDYNKMAEHFISHGLTRMEYTEVDDEIVIRDKKTNKLYFYKTIDKDFGYIEKIPNPYNSKKSVILFGGCHTVGVTSAVRFLSAYSNGKSKVSDIALNNAKLLVQKEEIKLDRFVILINSTKLGATISYPTASDIVPLDNGIDDNALVEKAAQNQGESKTLERNTSQQ